MTTENSGSEAEAGTKPKKLSGAAAKSHAAKTATQQAPEKEESKVLPAHLHTVLMLNLITDGEVSRNVGENERHYRKNFTLGGEAVNLFSPFSKADGKKSTNGLLRLQLPAVVDLIDKVNADQKVIIARQEEVAAFYESLIQRVESKVREMMIPDTFAVAAEQATAGEVPAELQPSAADQVGDLVKVTSWLGFAPPTGEVNEMYVATICITYHVSKVADVGETVQRLLKHRKSSLSVMLVNTITTDAEASNPSDILKGKTELAANTARYPYSYSQIAKNEQGFVWLPPAGEAEKMLSPNSIAYIAHVSTKEEQPAAE